MSHSDSNRHLPDTTRATRAQPLAVLACLALLLPGALAAQLTSIGLTEVGGQWFESNSPAEGDSFAFALAAGDFNGDGADDLATGIPWADDPISSGYVLIRYGSISGIQGAPPPQILRQYPEPAQGAFFGGSLAAGDFNGDGYDDLAIGAPFTGPDERGAVQVHWGSSAGLLFDFAEVIDEEAAGEPWHAVCGQTFFGFALAAGNFDGDAYDDLAIGEPEGCERLDVVSTVRGGSLFVAHGQEWGLLPWYGYRISQDSPGIYDQAEADDRFAASLAAADFNGDGYDDLAVGVLSEDSGGVADVGALHNIMGSPFGVIFANSVFWLPSALGEVPEEGDRLAFRLGTGDFDGDGHDDLAIGIPFETLGSGDVYPSTGQVDIAYGAADPAWFDLSRTDHFAQATIYGNEAHEAPNDHFGWAFASGDFDGDGKDDLAIGHEQDDWAGVDHGAVTILMGATPSLGASTRFHLIAVGWEGVPGDPTQVHQYSGSALAAGDFNGDGYPDLAIGVPFYDHGDVANSGGETVLYAAGPHIFADGFEAGSGASWSSSSF